MNRNKIDSLLGISARGRNLVSGEFAVENAVKDGSAELVIVAEDASENTQKLFRDKCAYYEIPFYTYGTRDSLGHAIGKDTRASVAITDAGLAKAIKGHLEDR